jgi:uncharacterized alpha-E superfamily protein
MLSRVADSLYWMSRYMERAEDVTRVLTVTFNALLDTQVDGGQSAWASLIAVIGDEEGYRKHFDTYTAAHVMAYLLWHEGNPNAVFTCINLARENARTVREQISSEVWEQINGLYYALRETKPDAILRSPVDFFTLVRTGSHAFQGVTHATMPHGEGFHFIQVGSHLERAEKTARILDVLYATLDGLEDGSPAQTIQLSVMLRSCSAMEAYRKAAKTLHPWRVAEFLLLNRDFPRSVMFCMNQTLQGLRAVTETGEHPAVRTAGRICADLDFLELDSVFQTGLHGYLDRLVHRINQLGDDVTRSFFSAQIILPGWRSYTQQIQQQQ